MERQIGVLCIRFDVDEQSERPAVAIDRTAIFFDTLDQWFQIKRLQRPVGHYVLGIVGNEKLTVEQVYICFHTRKAVGQGIEKWP